MTVQRFVLVGLILIAAGVFVPAWNTGDGTLNYFDNPYNEIPADGMGVYLLIVLAVTALVTLITRVDYIKLLSVFIFWILFTEFVGNAPVFYNDTDMTIRWGWGLFAIGEVLVCAPWWWNLRLGWNQDEADEADLLPDDDLLEPDVSEDAISEDM
jgi:hypothetical protein